MKKRPQLTNDARAVLVAAQLPNEEAARGFVRENGDVRRAQLERGTQRLEELGLVVKGSPLLTAEGVRVARKLQENEERLRAGIPFIERESAISLRGGRDTADVVDEWRTCELRGERLSTNGHMIFVGDPPSDNKMKRHLSETSIIAVWFEMLAGNPRPVRPAAYTELQLWRRRERLVWFDDGAALDAEIFAFIAARFRPLLWTHSTERDVTSRGQKSLPFALNAYSRGRRVAVAMPFAQEPSETVLALIEAARGGRDGGDEQEAEESVISRPFDSGAAVQLSLLAA
jgi:hypothetical protein